MGVKVKLNIVHEFPEELYHLDIKKVHQVLGGPTLIHLKGKRDDTLFLSTLLHANEVTSYLVLQKLMNKYRDVELPRDILIFIGNTFAAERGLRHLPGQVDYNRIWESGDLPEKLMAMEIFEYAKKQNLFASIDVHNNTGKNPLYGCVNVVREDFLNLAAHFGEHTVYFTEPHNVQSMAFSKVCPSTTIETGLPGDPIGVEAAFEYVDYILNSTQLTPSLKRDNSKVYHTLARMKVSENARIDFQDLKDSEADLSLIEDIDERNFEMIPKDTHLGYAKDFSKIRVEGNDGTDLSEHFLRCENGEILTSRLFIPSMFTKDIYVMKEDCLGYVMEVIHPYK